MDANNVTFICVVTTTPTYMPFDNREVEEQVLDLQLQDPMVDLVVGELFQVEVAETELHVKEMVEALVVLLLLIM